MLALLERDPDRRVAVVTFVDDTRFLDEGYDHRRVAIVEREDFLELLQV